MRRRKAREIILKILFQRDFRNSSLEELLEGRSFEDPYIMEVLRGIEAKRQELDRIISAKAQGWRLERLVSVDRNILRLSLYEILYRQDVPPEVAINEAIELAKKYSTEDSGRFINGILDRVWKERAAFLKK